MKKKTVKYMGMVFCIVMSAAVILIAVFLYDFLRGNVRESSGSIADYRKWSLSDRYTQFLIFPEKLPGSAENVEYYYKYEDGWTRPMCQIYLSYILSQEDYEAEEKRLAALSWESEERGHLTVQRDTTSFRYPAYVTIAGYDFCYEYVLMCKQNNTIVYIYTMNTIKEDLKFNQEFLPDYFMEGFDDLSVEGIDRFTMYGGYDSLLKK